MKPTQTRIGDLWCKLMHMDSMWPSHGQYECWTRGHRHQVCWEQPLADIRRTVLLPNQAQTNVAVRSYTSVDSATGYLLAGCVCVNPTLLFMPRGRTFWPRVGRPRVPEHANLAQPTATACEFCTSGGSRAGSAPRLVLPSQELGRGICLSEGAGDRVGQNYQHASFLYVSRSQRKSNSRS